MNRGMKAKTIAQVIGRKVDDWLASIEDEALREAISKKVVVTGGCVASMLLGEKVSDFDVYLSDLGAAEAVARYYVGKFQAGAKGAKHADGRDVEMSVVRAADYKGEERVQVKVQSAGIASERGSSQYSYFETVGETRPEAEQYVEDQMAVLQDDDVQDGGDGLPAYRPVFFSSNAITLSGRIQVVLRFTGDPAAIHANYDFVHCTNHWTSAERKLVLNPAALEALLTRELRYVGSRYPLCSVIRTRKFIQRGWVINAGQMLKMMLQMGELDLKRPEVLRDQLTGVDAAYFAEVLHKIEAAAPEDLNAAYLIAIIDRMF